MNKENTQPLQPAHCNADGCDTHGSLSIADQFRVHALDLDATLKRSARNAAHALPSSTTIQDHWIMQDHSLARMVTGVQLDLEALATCGVEQLHTPIEVIDRLGFLHEQPYCGFFAETRFMARFFLACTRMSVSCGVQLLRHQMHHSAKET